MLRTELVKINLNTTKDNLFQPNHMFNTDNTHRSMKTENNMFISKSTQKSDSKIMF